MQTDRMAYANLKKIFIASLSLFLFCCKQKPLNQDFEYDSNHKKDYETALNKLELSDLGFKVVEGDKLVDFDKKNEKHWEYLKASPRLRVPIMYHGMRGLVGHGRDQFKLFMDHYDSELLKLKEGTIVCEPFFPGDRVITDTLEKSVSEQATDLKDEVKKHVEKIKGIFKDISPGFEKKLRFDNIGYSQGAQVARDSRNWQIGECGLESKNFTLVSISGSPAGGSVFIDKLDSIESTEFFKQSAGISSQNIKVKLRDVSPDSVLCIGGYMAASSDQLIHAFALGPLGEKAKSQKVDMKTVYNFVKSDICKYSEHTDKANGDGFFTMSEQTLPNINCSRAYFPGSHQLITLDQNSINQAIGTGHIDKIFADSGSQLVGTYLNWAYKQNAN